MTFITVTYALEQHITQQTNKLYTLNVMNFLINYHELNSAIKDFLEGKKITNPKYIDFNVAIEAFRIRRHLKYLFATNFGLFSNNGFPLEYTFKFWVQNITYQYLYKKTAHNDHTFIDKESDAINKELEVKDLLQKKLTHIFESLEASDVLPDIIDDFFYLYEQIFKNNPSKSNGGRLLSIFVNPSIADKVAYIGIHLPLNISWNNTKLYLPSQFLPLYKTNPTLCELLLRRSSQRMGIQPEIFNPNFINSDKKAQIREHTYISRQDRDHNELISNRMFSAFFVDPQVAYDPQNVKVVCHDLFFTSPEQKQEYFTGIKELVTKWLHYLKKKKSWQESVQNLMGLIDLSTILFSLAQ